MEIQLESYSNYQAKANGSIESLVSKEQLEIGIKENPNNTYELQKELLNEYNQVLQKYSRQSEKLKEFNQMFHRSNSLEDTLENIRLLTPDIDDINDNYKYKYLFQTMDKNCLNLKVILNKLNQLFSKVKDLVINLKKKLENLKGQMKLEQDSSQNLMVFLEQYIKNQFNSDSEIVKGYREELNKLLNSINEIQSSEDTINLSQITKARFNYLRQAILEQSNSNHIIQGFQDSIGRAKQDILSFDTEMINFEKTIIEIDAEIKKQNIIKERLKSEKQMIDTNLNYFEELLEEQSQMKKSINIDQLKINYVSESEKRKMDFIEQIKQENQKQKDNITSRRKELDLKIIQQMNKDQQHHIIILIDDSASMHDFEGIFTKTKFQLATESVKELMISLKNSGNRNDYASIIKFSSQSFIIHQKEKISQISLKLDLHPQRQGMNFNSAFQKCFEACQLSSEKENIVIIFLTNGESTQSTQCELYLNKMIGIDGGLKMFSLGVGKQIDINFLKSISKIANRGTEIMNKGFSHPIPFFQQILDPSQLTKVFKDISLGIQESRKIIQDEVKCLEKQIQMEKKQFEESIEHQKQRISAVEKEKFKKIDELEKVLNKSTMQETLKNQKNEEEKKLKQVLHEIFNIQKLIDTLLVQRAFQEKVKKETTEKIQEKKQSILLKIKEWEEIIQKDEESNEEYMSIKMQYLSEIGIKSESAVEFWNISIKQFPTFLKIMQRQVNQFYCFFNSFADISDNLIPQLSLEEISKPFSIESQIETIILFYNKPNEPHEWPKQNEEISLEFIIDKIVKEKYYINNHSLDDQKIVEEVKQLILEETRSIYEFVNGLTFNQEHSGKKQRMPRLQLLLKIIKKKQEEEYEDVNQELRQSVRYFINIGVFNDQRLRKMKNNEDFENIIQRIDFFDFDNPANNEEDDFVFESSSDSNDESDEGEGKSETTKQKNENQGKEKIQDVKPKNLKKFKPLSLEKVEEITAKFEKYSKRKLKLVRKHRAEKNQIEKIYRIIESTCSSIFFHASRQHKIDQIKQIETFINENFINQIDELLQFNK